LKRICHILVLLLSFFTTKADEPWSPQVRRKIDSLNRIIAKTSDRDTTKVSCVLEEVSVLYFNSPDTAIALSKIALQLAEKLNFYEAAAEANGWLGYLIESKGNADSALIYYQKSYELREKIGNKNAMAVSLNNIGFIYKSKGNIPLALEYLHRSLKLLEEVNDRSGIAYLLNNMGSIYNSLGEDAKALEYYHKSLKIREEIKDQQGIAYSMNNLGSFYKQKGDLLKALRYYNNGLMIQEKLNNKQGYANSLQNAGELYYLLGDVSKAESYFNNSLGKFEELQEKNGISNSLNFLAEIKLKNNDLGLALSLAERSLKIAKEIGYPENIKNASSILKKIYLKNGNLKDAFAMQVLCKQMTDSINNENNRKLAIQKGFQYAYETKKAADDIRSAAERKVFEAESKQKKLQILLMIIGIILISTLSFFIYKRFKITSYQKMLIEKQKLEVNFQRELADKTRLVVEEQKHVLQEKQKEILDSIHYAKRIQQVILTDPDLISKQLNSDFFIHYLPKDIVSGDFYWATKKNDKFYIAVCDSTGHGVPGAFMSLLNIGFLSEAIDQLGIEKPSDILNYVRKRLIENISKEGQKDGFDGILMCVDNTTKKITYAAAHNSPLLIRNKQIITQACDHMPVGIGEKTQEFNLYTIDHQHGDRIYLYTDGYADQFGGPKGKKFKYKQLEELLLNIHQLPMTVQKEKLAQNFETWRGELEQIDDVLVMGIGL
jgi:serine phosphatase RsbU (regulator of sigma subunit)